MKRLFYKSILLSLLLAWTSMGSYAQSWDFTSIPTSDEENLKVDTETGSMIVQRSVIPITKLSPMVNSWPINRCSP